jgi:hypothetical protein
MGEMRGRRAQGRREYFEKIDLIDLIDLIGLIGLIGTCVTRDEID